MSADARTILSTVPRSDWKRPAGRPYTSRLATVKNNLSSLNHSVQDATKLALEWCRPISDDDGDDDDDDGDGDDDDDDVDDDDDLLSKHALRMNNSFAGSFNEH